MLPSSITKHNHHAAGALARARRFNNAAACAAVATRRPCDVVVGTGSTSTARVYRNAAWRSKLLVPAAGGGGAAVLSSPSAGVD